MMELIHISTMKLPDGLHEVEVAIDGRIYIYLLRDEEDVRAFERQYMMGRKLLGQALEHLKKNQVKFEEKAA